MGSTTCKAPSGRSAGTMSSKCTDRRRMDWICTSPASPSTATPSNLVSRAYHLIKERYGIGGVTAHLHKVIPMGAGLGGGSSDGTCMLRLLDALFGLNLSDEDGEALAAELGSDCPFFWRAQPALVTGRGEHLEAWHFEFPADTHIAIAHPGIHVSTRDAFQGVTLSPAPWTSTPWPRRHCPNGTKSCGTTSNRASKPCIPPSDRCVELLQAQGALYSQMTGTGSACFGLFPSEESALKACKAARANGWTAYAPKPTGSPTSAPSSKSAHRPPQKSNWATTPPGATNCRLKSMHPAAAPPLRHKP